MRRAIHRNRQIGWGTGENFLKHRRRLGRYGHASQEYRDRQYPS
jgi:hypothetical protein